MECQSDRNAETEAVLSACVRELDKLPTFDWDNNWTLRETRIQGRGKDGMFGPWTEWERASFTDPDAFLAQFTESDTWNEDTDNVDVLDSQYGDAWTPECNNRGFVLYHGSFGMQYRERSIYPGLYANVERLKRWIRDESGCPDVFAVITDALTMILAHDRAERDHMTPEGYCRHGVYVGGMGWDRMCGACEAGEE